MNLMQNHRAVYGILMLMTLSAVTAGALVIGYMRSNHKYDVQNNKGFTDICFKFEEDCTTLTNYLEIAADGCLYHPECVTDVFLDGGTLGYQTSAQKAYLAASIIAMVAGGIGFILCCVGMYYTAETAK